MFKNSCLGVILCQEFNDLWLGFVKMFDHLAPTKPITFLWDGSAVRSLGGRPLSLNDPVRLLSGG